MKIAMVWFLQKVKLRWNFHHKLEVVSYVSLILCALPVLDSTDQDKHPTFSFERRDRLEVKLKRSIAKPLGTSEY